LQPVNFYDAVQLGLRNNLAIEASAACAEAVRQGITVTKSDLRKLDIKPPL